MKLTKTRAVSLLVAALLWVISPWDGDFLPIVGWIDDMLVMALALYTMWRSFRTPREPHRGPENAKRVEPLD